MRQFPEGAQSAQPRIDLQQTETMRLQSQLRSLVRISQGAGAEEKPSMVILPWGPKEKEKSK